MKDRHTLATAGVIPRLVFTLPILLLLADCSKNPNGTAQTSGPLNGGTKDDEVAALAAPAFRAPLVLHVDSDASNVVDQIVALNGVNPKPTQGSQWETGAYPGCSGIDGQEYGVSASIMGIAENVSIDQDQFKGWMLRNIYELRKYPVTYTNVQQGTGGGNLVVYSCPVIRQSVAQYLPADQQGGNLHGGLDIPFARRAFAAWTFENRYETPTSGQGTVKVFAGTFSYTVQSTISTLSFNGQGTGSVKIQLNPDNGHWDFLQINLQDPQLVFQ